LQLFSELLPITGFDVIKNCLALIALKTGANTVCVNTFLGYSNCSKCLPLNFTYCLNLFLKRGTALYCWKFSRVLSSATVFGFGWSYQKVSCIAPQTWY